MTKSLNTAYVLEHYFSIKIVLFLNRFCENKLIFIAIIKKYIYDKFYSTQLKFITYKNIRNSQP